MHGEKIEMATRRWAKKEKSWAHVNTTPPPPTIIMIIITIYSSTQCVLWSVGYWIWTYCVCTLSGWANGSLSATARMNVLFVCMYSNEACHTQMKLYLIQLPLGWHRQTERMNGWKSFLGRGGGWSEWERWSIEKPIKLQNIIWFLALNNTYTHAPTFKEIRCQVWIVKKILKKIFSIKIFHIETSPRSTLFSLCFFFFFCSKWWIEYWQGCVNLVIKFNWSQLLAFYLLYFFLKFFNRSKDKLIEHICIPIYNCVGAGL